MKILIDECLPISLKKYFSGYDIFNVMSVSEMGWKSLKNGELLKTAVENNFDVFLTADKKLEFQQNLSSVNIAVVVLEVNHNKIEYLEPLKPKFIKLSNNL